MDHKPIENLVISSHEIINNVISPSSSKLNKLTISNNTNDALNNFLQDTMKEGKDCTSNMTSNLNLSPKPSPRHSKKNNNTNHLQKNSYNSINLNGYQVQDLSLLTSSSTDTTKNITEQKKDKKNNHRGKKKSWYSNVFFPTYKSRSIDFKKIFKDIPNEERLIVDYSCALQREILVHGRLYISQNYACFYANIFMWETLVSIRWKDVTAITKEKTALVIPNAILITTATNKFFFASFGSRDKTYVMIFKIWQNALLEKPMSNTEIWKLVHECYGEQLGLTSDDEDYHMSHAISPNEEKSSVAIYSDTVSDITNIENSLTIVPDALLKSTSNSLNSVTEKEIETSDIFENDSDSEKNSLLDSSIDNTIKCDSTHEGKQLVKAVIPINVDQLFTLLFTNSKFFLDFHTSRKTTDLVQSVWVQDDNIEQKTRTVSLTLFLNQAIGPKSSQVKESQVLLPCSKSGQLYSIDTESINAGIPYANSFVVFSHYCLRKISENETSLTVYADIKYKKNVWVLVKSFIEKNCWLGMEEYFRDLLTALNAECKEINVEESSLKKQIRRRQITSSGITIQTQSPDYTAFNRHDSVKEKSRHLYKIFPDLSNLSGVINWVLLAAVIILLIINGILCYKIWSVDDSNSYTVMDLNEFKNTPKSEEDWINLLQQQESLHNVEMKRWQRILHTAVQLLRQTEESLTQLQMSIHPTATEKMFSVLKSGLNNANPRNEHNNQEL